VLRSGRSRRRFLALITYYAFTVLLVGPAFFTPVEADTKPRIPVRISLNVALRTRTTDVATFTTPFPITVGVAGDGTFTIPRNSLGFALVDVPLEAAHPGLGRLSVRAESVSDFGGTVDTRTGEVTLQGFLELLWTRPHPLPGQLHMVDCPVGPFALHLSTATVGGGQLAHQSVGDAASRTARLVDDNLAIDAIPIGTPQCDGGERNLNQALSLPIVPRVDTTTSTSTSTSTTTIAPTTSSTEATTTTTAAVDPATTATTVDPTATTIESTTTATAAESMTPSASPPDAAAPDAAAAALTATAAAESAARTTGGLGTELDPSVLAFEPIPSMVSTLTIAAVPAANSGSTPPTENVVSPRSTPSTVAHSGDTRTPRRHAVVAARTSKHKRNKHAQTTPAAVTPTPAASAANNKTPPLYFSPLNFGAVHKPSPRNPLLAPVPILGLGAEAIAKHRDLASIVFIALLILPLIAISGGLIAADFGARVPFLGRRRRRARPRTKPTHLI
jgi:hypothetical protein